MTQTEALVALNMVTDVGSVRLNKLLEYFEKPENIFKASVRKLAEVLGIGAKISGQIASLTKEDLMKEISSVEKLHLKIITLYDKDYPENLKNIPGAPIVLYVSGELKEEDKSAIGIVGSRRASFYGLSSAEKFGFELAQNNFTVVSGMARGIDTCAHRGALKARGRTIAVIGSGFNNIYPSENKELAEEISKSGAVISEFPVDTKPLAHNFPRRNRVISGLSLGVLVVEAAQNSGALITADFALEQGRDVFAIPGKVDSANSFGTNELIKQGAKLVSSTDDILEEFNLKADVGSIPRLTERKEPRDLILVNCEEAVLYDLLSKQPLFIDEIVESTDFDLSRIMEALLGLQLKKLVKQLPGKQFIRT